MNFQATPDYETALQVAVDGGNAPDLAQIAQPGKMHQYAEAASLVALDGWINTEKLSSLTWCRRSTNWVNTTATCTASTTRPM